MSALTNREIQTLAAAAEGYDVKTTAEQFGVSPETVKSFRERMRKKLRARNTAHAVALGLREGFIR
jgi:DNA-binding CsgD family transcriptional regulator